MKIRPVGTELFHADGQRDTIKIIFPATLVEGHISFKYIFHTSSRFSDFRPRGKIQCNSENAPVHLAHEKQKNALNAFMAHWKEMFCCFNTVLC